MHLNRHEKTKRSGGAAGIPAFRRHYLLRSSLGSLRSTSSERAQIWPSSHPGPVGRCLFVFHIIIIIFIPLRETCLELVVPCVVSLSSPSLHSHYEAIRCTPTQRALL